MQKLLLIAALTLSTVASAAWMNKSGERLPETAYRKSSGDFVAQMIFIGDENELFTTWNKPAESVNVKDIETIDVNSPISTFIVFGGCKPDDKGKCNVAMRFRVIGPDGKIYSETPEMEVWNAKPAPPDRSLQLSIDYLKIVVEPHEQPGRYVVNTEVQDKHSGSVLKLQKSFIASKRAAR